MQKKVAIPSLVVGAALGAGLAGRSMVRRWALNADPLESEPPWFPEGEVRVVKTPDGASLHTVTAGHAGPTVLFVHGLTASIREWGPIARHLIESGIRVIAVDQRGHGGSTAGNGRFGSAALATDLATVFDTLDIEASLLVGQSMGGMAAMAFATDHPEVFSARVDRLALVATTASMAAPRSQAALRFGSIPIPDAFDPADERLRVATALT
ncbi:MAG: alpha/beta fold hydrolase, partial [Acidimicrobiales bacterium]